MLDVFKKLAQELPEKPGIYRFYSQKELLYIGKANSLRHRTMSYLQKVHNSRLESMLGSIDHIEYVVTNSAVEALILEAQEIQTKQPPLNIDLKDDKSFLGVYITNEEFPRVFAARLTRRNLPEGIFYGPYTSAKTLRYALKIIRRIFGYCDNPELRKIKRPCFYYHIGQCPGVCTGEISSRDYKKHIHHLIMFLQGKKKLLLSSLNQNIKLASKNQEYTLAAQFKKQLDALQQIHDANFELPDLGPKLGDKTIRIEGYDISNISGQHASGSMVVMECSEKQCQLNTNQYRRFNIKTINGPDDIKMLEEMLVRRARHEDWPKPDLILVDGGKGHLAMAKQVVKVFRLACPVIAMAKGPQRKRSDIYGDIKQAIKLVSNEDLTKVRDEAHRFAISGYRKRHRSSLLENKK